MVERQSHIPGQRPGLFERSGVWPFAQGELSPLRADGPVNCLAQANGLGFVFCGI